MIVLSRPGDLVTYKRDPGSLYMVIENWRGKLFVVGANGKGHIDSNNDDFINLGKIDFGPYEGIFEYKKVKREYEEGSFFDYLYKSIKLNKFKIINDNPDFKERIGYEVIDRGIKFDPTKKEFEYLYKGNFIPTEEK